MAIRKRNNQVYTRKKFNEQVKQVKKINRIYGQRGGTKL